MEIDGTRTRILDVAERLYARRGLDSVSLREIAAAAGQRNNAAVHYHFGGRNGLVRALFERRYARLEQRRRTMLARLDRSGRGDDVRALVEVLALPFAEDIDGSGGHWVRFVARLHEDARYNPFAACAAGRRPPYAAAPEAVAASREVTDRIRRAIGLAERLMDARLFLVTTMVVHAVADREALIASGEAHALPGTRVFLTGLVDAATAVLTAPAPVSRTTR